MGPPKSEPNAELEASSKAKILAVDMQRLEWYFTAVLRAGDMPQTFETATDEYFMVTFGWAIHSQDLD